MKKHNQYIVSFLLLICIVFFNACEKFNNPDCEDEKRYPLTEDDLKWIPSADTHTFKVTTRNSGITTDTIKEFYSFSNNERYETTEWCGQILRIIKHVSIYFPLDNGNIYGSYHLQNTRKGGGMQIHFGTDEYLNADTKLDTALVNGKLYHDVYKTRSGNYLAKGVGWIFLKNEQNETAELIPTN